MAEDANTWPASNQRNGDPALVLVGPHCKQQRWVERALNRQRNPVDRFRGIATFRQARQKHLVAVALASTSGAISPP